MTWFARGLGAARLGRLDGAGQALDRLEALEGVAEEAGEALFARQIWILRLGVAAWAAQARGEEALAVEQMTQAADLEASTPKPPVTPGPTLPASELLGDLMMAQGRLGEAFEAYERSLDLTPRRFNGLLGAARAARALGETLAARAFYTELVESSAAGSTREGLAEARAFLSASPH